MRTIVHALVLLVAAASSSVAGAAIVASESFDYGATGGNLSGNNGGTGFGAGWSGGTGVVTYTPTGLSFGSLATSGGAARWSTTLTTATSSNRALAGSLGAGTFYVGYLFNLDNRDQIRTVQSFLLGPSNSTDNTATVGLAADEFNVDVSSMRTLGSATNLSGTAPQLDTTYLYLARLDLAANAQTVTAWVLSAAQFDDFKNGGLTQAELDGATLGTGVGQVVERGTRSDTDALGATSHLLLDGYTGGSGSQTAFYDELRISNLSLDEITAVSAVPEPGTLALLAVGGVVFARRRRLRAARSRG